MSAISESRCHRRGLVIAVDDSLHALRCTSVTNNVNSEARQLQFEYESVLAAQQELEQELAQHVPRVSFLSRRMIGLLSWSLMFPRAASHSSRTGTPSLWNVIQLDYLHGAIARREQVHAKIASLYAFVFDGPTPGTTQLQFPCLLALIHT